MSPQIKTALYLLPLIFLLFPTTITLATTFNFTSFPPNTPGIIYQGDAFPSGQGVIQLTRNQVDGTLQQSEGRAIYRYPIQLWDSKTRTVTDFVTHFEFTINGLNATYYGDGLAFFLAPVDAVIPLNSSGGWLGLYNETTDKNSSAQVVAVEIDTYQNPWDPSPNHIGIDINSITSVTTVICEDNIRNGSKGQAWIAYNATTKDLQVRLSYGEDGSAGQPSLSHNVDLMEILPEMVIVGFSAATGWSTELHTILSWDFQSNFGLGMGMGASKGIHKKKVKWTIGGVVSLVVILMAIGLYLWRKLKLKGSSEIDIDASMEDKFIKGTGPRKFDYKELVNATKNFSEEGKLGEGGFGGVYKGVFDGSIGTVAVKRVSKGSKQGKKEYVSEVTIISRLRHRNLVRLIGWCHDQRELLLVYEFMPNGSLDSHLFGKQAELTWETRYKIALGLANALLYLHEEWEQCVVHRDIKSSNVMLDSNFNAKLGDFGLARLVDHDSASQTTVIAGTMGYLAPECVTTGKASKESDIFSFGAVALEIACGRRPVEPFAQSNKVRLVEWVWELYGKDGLQEAVDQRLNDVYDAKQMECLMVVGLWCSHPEHTMRPSIRQVIHVLNFQSSMPVLPSKLPVAMYYAPPLDQCQFAYTSMTSLHKSGPSCSSSSCTSTTLGSTGSSRASSTKSLLNTHPIRPISNMQ